MPIEELLATPPLPPIEEVEEAPPLFHGLFLEWVNKLTVGQLRSLMGAQHISRARGNDYVSFKLLFVTKFFFVNNLVVTN